MRLVDRRGLVRVKRFRIGGVATVVDHLGGCLADAEQEHGQYEQQSSERGGHLGLLPYHARRADLSRHYSTGRGRREQACQAIGVRQRAVGSSSRCRLPIAYAWQSGCHLASSPAPWISTRSTT